MKITTERMTITPLTNEEMQAKIDAEKDEEMKIAYSEMLTGCMEKPEQRIWYAIWIMQMNNGTKEIIGDLSFKGLNDGTVEIGYGMRPEYQGQGYMTEAVTAMAEWASMQPGVDNVEAEAESDNLASIRVLEKSGFELNGVMGAEGPRFIWNGQTRKGE